MSIWMLKHRRRTEDYLRCGTCHLPLCFLSDEIQLLDGVRTFDPLFVCNVFAMSTNQCYCRRAHFVGYTDNRREFIHFTSCQLVRFNADDEGFSDEFGPVNELAYGYNTSYEWLWACGRCACHLFYHEGKPRFLLKLHLVNVTYFGQEIRCRCFNLLGKVSEYDPETIQLNADIYVKLVYRVVLNQ